MLTTISAAIADLKINCVSIAARVNKKGTGIITFGLEITGTQDMERVIKRVRQISGVQSVNRVTN